ncbi:MAG: hypothetical protein COB02_01815 [Candidatus Cloacimonadota bacterium]|nr:MAG: hypothetical protein COB02_01815 [Candidatus Cloacimonadota bacterium]
MIEFNDEGLRKRILRDIIPFWPTTEIQKFSDVLSIYATHPNSSNTDLDCFKLLIKYQLVDLDWIYGWIQMRRVETLERMELMNELLTTLSQSDIT